MRHAIEDLNLNRLSVLYAGKDRFSLSKQVEAIGLAELLRRKTFD